MSTVLCLDSGVNMRDWDSGVGIKVVALGATSRIGRTGLACLWADCSVMLAPYFDEHRRRLRSIQLSQADHLSTLP
jgi:hypothetical protein